MWRILGSIFQGFEGTFLFFFLHLKDLLHGFTRLLVCGNLKDLLQLSCDNLETHSEGFQKD